MLPMLALVPRPVGACEYNDDPRAAEEEEEEGAKWLPVVVCPSDPIPFFSSIGSDKSIDIDIDIDVAHFVSSLLLSLSSPWGTTTCSHSRRPRSSFVFLGFAVSGLLAAGTIRKIFSNNGVAPSSVDIITQGIKLCNGTCVSYT